MAKSDLMLIAGESVVSIVAAEMNATSTNFTENINALLKATLGRFIGISEKGQLTITNKRVVLERKSNVLWCCTTKGVFETILPNACAGVAYGYKGTFLGIFVKKYFVQIKTTGGDALELYPKGGKKATVEICNMLTNVLVK